MLHLRSLLTATVLLLAVRATAAPKQVTLIHVNDTHSHLAAWGPKDENLDGTVGGLEKAATIIAAERAAPDALFVHAGDLIHGDPFFNAYLGVPELLLLEQLGLDVLVPGNHELQFGPELLAGVLAGAWPAGGGVAIVGTNLELSAFPVLGVWITSTVVKDAGGVKVGFIGLTTPWDPLEIPGPVVIRDDLAAVTQAAADELRGAGAEVVVCLAHIGLDRSRELAQAVSGVDVIVQGHDHAALAQPEAVAASGGGVTYLVAAGSYYGWVGKLRLAVDAGAVSLVDYVLIPVDESVPRLPDLQPTIAALEAGIVERFGDIYHEAVGWARAPIPNGWDPAHKSRDTAVGDLFTDAYRAATGTDIAIEVGGFLDEGLPAGALVGADLIRAMSYGLPAADPTGAIFVPPARLATFTMTGADLLQALELCLAEGGDLFPQVSGMRLDYDSSRPALSRIKHGTVHVGGAQIDPARRYTVTTNEVLVQYLPAFGVAVEDVAIQPGSAWAAAEALVRARGVLDGDTSGRIRDLAPQGSRP
jgi:5'-nucleotidase